MASSEHVGNTMIGAIYQSFNEPIKISNDLPIPRPPPDGVIVKIMATGVCRSDWHGWRGHDGDIKQYIEKHGTPFVPGHEASGIVVEVGSDIKQFKRMRPESSAANGMRRSASARFYNGEISTLFVNDSNAIVSYVHICCLITNTDISGIIPDGVSFVEAAALGCRYTTAYRAVLQQGQLCEKGSSHSKVVAVFGCGGLGLSCVAIAAAFGAKRIIAVDVSKYALEKALELGASDTILSTIPKQNEEIDSQNSTVYENIMRLTDNVGADLTIDAGGFKQTCTDAVWACRRGGRMVQVGLPSSQPILPLSQLLGEN
eukprot:scaffold29919_cov70-Cyclotella_meneghiniana.AAC.15